MRTYGRTYDEFGNATWVVVKTDANGFNDEVYITTLAQCCYLEPGESPFYAQYGIPGAQSVITQIYPDYYVALTQQQFAPYFASLTVARLSNQPATLKQAPVPTYQFGIVTHQGAILPAIQIPNQIPV